MVKAHGTLSTRGWLITPEARLERLLTEYECANPSQTLIYRGSVSSLQATAQRVGTEPDALSAAIQDDLERKVSRCFPERPGVVEVNCLLNREEDKVTIEIGITVYENNTPYSLNRVLASRGSTFIRVTGATIV